MNGIGVMKRSEQLSDRLFLLLIPFTLGGAFGAMCTMYVFGWGPAMFPSYNPMTAVGAIVGFALCLPWVKTAIDLHIHTARTEAETKSRGKGWARN